MIYLDNAATTPVSQGVLKAMLPYFTDKWYNPSSLYSPAAKIKQDVENARKTVAGFINADSSEIYFTSGGSEANCWAIKGYTNTYRNKPSILIITTDIEHKSILSCVNNLDYAFVHYIGVDECGFINLTELEKELRYGYGCLNGILISIQFANNEIGTIQHIKEISDLAHKYGAVFHTDAVQAFGHIPIDVKDLGIDMLSASGHKVHAPKGIGFLYIRKGINIEPLINGTQMDGMRGGTENVPYIMGMAKAVELCNVSDEKIQERVCIRNYFINALMGLGCKVNGAIINNSESNNLSRLPNNINVTFPQRITGEALIYMLDTVGIMISSGSACNSHTNKPSQVLITIGLTDNEIMRTVRLTFSDDLTEKDIDKVICEIKKILKLFSYDERKI